MNRVWAWFHKWTSPKWFFLQSFVWSKWLGWLALGLISTSLFWALFIGSPDYQQGNSFRIFYIHLPAAMLAQSVFLMMAVAGFVLLVWRIKLAEIFIKIAAPFGASITLLALLTGAIWGKPTWGTWWEWDARLTSTLIQFFLYLGVIAIYEALEKQADAGKAAALTSLVGAINVPIIKYSVEWWNTLHQPATFTLTEKPAMPVEMWMPALISVLGFYCFFGWLVFTKMRTEIMLKEKKSIWLKQYFSEENI